MDKKTYDDPKLLAEACNQVFMIQGGMATLSLVGKLFSFSLGLSHITLVVMCLVGFFATKEFNPDSWKFVTAPSIYMFFNTISEFFGFFLSLDFTFTGLIIILLKTGLGLFQVSAFAVLVRNLQAQSLKGNSFYLNFMILNKEEVLEKKITEKVGKASRLGKFASKIANKGLSEEKFCRNMMTKMQEDIPMKIASKGITAIATGVFSKRNYFVLKITIVAIDLPKMLGDKSKDKEAGLAKSQKVRDILAKLPVFIRTELEYLMNLVIAGGMVKNMPTQMVLDIKEKAGMEVEIVGKDPTQQADFFYELMETISPAQPAGATGVAAAAEETVEKESTVNEVKENKVKEAAHNAKEAVQNAREKGRAKIAGFLGRGKDNSEE